MAGLSGAEAEKLAKRHLKAAGLSCLSQNYSCRWGEIDLIMGDNQTLVFVEVRYRHNQRFGGALESITPAKQQKIRLSAEDYMQNMPHLDYPFSRFDVVTIAGSAAMPELDWIKDAFE